MNNTMGMVALVKFPGGCGAYAETWRMKEVVTEWWGREQEILLTTEDKTCDKF